MSHPRSLSMERDAAGALVTILGIVLDNVHAAHAEGMRTSWDTSHVIDLDARFHQVWPELAGLWQGSMNEVPADERREVELHIEDAELLLAGMAFTEMASTDLPFFEMVQWTSEFIAAELRQLWSDEVWRERAGGR